MDTRLNIEKRSTFSASESQLLTSFERCFLSGLEGYDTVIVALSDHMIKDTGTEQLFYMRAYD
jgi:hypothetical protein